MRTRDKMVSLMLTEEERDELKGLAAWFGMTVSEYLRHIAFGNVLESTMRERAKRRELGVEHGDAPSA